MASSKDTAIWSRVSTAEQRNQNQLDELEAWAEQQGLNVVARYVTEDSAFANGNGGKGRAFDQARTAMLAGVRQGKHPVVLCWAVDRLSRLGSEDMQRYLRMLAEAGGDVRSLKDPWLNTVDPFAREILLGIMGALARFESQRRSERIKAGLERRKKEGLPVGRQPGAKDKHKRRTDAYHDREEAKRRERTS